MRARQLACVLVLLAVACTAEGTADPAVSAGPTQAPASPAAEASPSDAAAGGPVVAVTVAAGGPPDALAGVERARMVWEYPIAQADTGLVVLAGQPAGATGPVRAATPSDAALASAFGTALVTAQATGALVEQQQRTGLAVIEEHAPAGLLVRDAARRAPFNLYARVSEILTQAPSPDPRSVRWPRGTGPLGAGQPLTELAVTAAPELTIVWTWEPTSSRWLRTYDGQLQQQANGARVGADTVVLLIVNPSGRLPVIGDLRGSGPAVVLNAGQRHGARWRHAPSTALPQITGADGVPLALNADLTWVHVCAAPCS